ncbi:MAG TPA: cupin-like domain-containing protein [Allosphingosinicella sp.]
MSPAVFEREVAPAFQPLILRGVVRHWPAVRSALQAPAAAAEYLGRFYKGRPVEAFVGPADIAGRFFYSDDLSGFNFEKQQGPLTGVLDYLTGKGAEEGARSVYVGAASVPDCLPGFTAENPLPLLGQRPAVPRIWIGNRTSVSTHFDMSDNIAAVVAGRRRFILFPPDQVANLYVGPIDHTMAGQPASMVSVQEPDFERFPRFREALEHAMVGELEPGDAIYVPSLWWHQVDALSSFNILINYWWNDGPPDAGSPFEAMVHGLFAIGHMPRDRREAWRAMFNHYVFQRGGHPAEHLPVELRGVLGPPSPQLHARIRQFLLQALGRR